jgi:Ca2+-binding EF-hand superfamily protein
LIYKLVEFIRDENNKNKLFDSFKFHMDAQKEVSDKDFKKILDDIKIKNTAKQRQHLFKLLDSDNDVMVSYGELEVFLNSYESDKDLSTNIISRGLKNQSVLK